MEVSLRPTINVLTMLLKSQVIRKNEINSESADNSFFGLFVPKLCMRKKINSLLGYTSKIVVGIFAYLLWSNLAFGQNPSDGCTGVPALTVGASCSTTAFTLPGGYSNGGLVSSSCVGGSNDRDDGWYSVTPATSGTLVIDMDGDRLRTLAVWTACGGGSEIVCDKQNNGVLTTVSFAATGGTTYYVQIHRHGGNNNADLTGTICAYMSTNMVTNGDFAAGAASWTDCGNFTEVMATSQWHGGIIPYTPNDFAEIDTHTDGVLGSADDRVLCQNVPGFTIGSDYTICLDVQRRPGPSACTTSHGQPGTVTSTLTMDNGALSTVISQSNTTWGWTNVCYTFTATSTTHLLSITPNEISSCGMLVTNIVVNPVVVLPIELSSFSASEDNGKVRLDWSTSTEVNNDYFTVQRSKNGIVWEDLLETEGAGNSQEPSDYIEYDRKPLNGIAYYRLKQTDFDGNTSFSIVESVDIDVDYSISPNPTHGEIAIAIEDDEVSVWSIEIYSVLGEKIYQEAGTGSNEMKVELPNMSGMYAIRITVDGQTRCERIIKL